MVGLKIVYGNFGTNVPLRDWTPSDQDMNIRTRSSTTRSNGKGTVPRTTNGYKTKPMYVHHTRRQVSLEKSLYLCLNKDLIAEEPHLTDVIEALRFREEPVTDKLLDSNSIGLLQFQLPGDDCAAFLLHSRVEEQRGAP